MRRENYINYNQLTGERVSRGTDFYTNCGRGADNPFYLLFTAAQEAGIDIRIEPNATDYEGTPLPDTVAVYGNRQTRTLLRTIIDSPGFGLIRDAFWGGFSFEVVLAEEAFGQEAALMLARTRASLRKIPVRERTDEKLQEVISVDQIKALLKEIILEQVHHSATQDQQSV